MIEVRADGKIYVFDDSSRILGYLYAKALNVKEDTPEPVTTGLYVPTPMGIIRAVPSMDSHNPGIFLSYLTLGGKESSSMLLEYNKASRRMKGYIWSPEDPDGDPVVEHLMDDGTVSGQK